MSVIVMALDAFAGCGGSATTSDATTVAVTPAPSPGTSAAIRPAVAFGGVDLPKGHELEAVQQSCQICHSLDMVYTQRLSKATWTAEVTKMMKFGAPLPASDKSAVVAYLTKYLGPTVPRSNVRATALAPVTTYSAAPVQP